MCFEDEIGNIPDVEKMRVECRRESNMAPSITYFSLEMYEEVNRCVDLSAMNA